MLFALAVIGLTLAGAAYLRAEVGAKVVVAARDLPAYHRLAQADLREENVSRGSVPDGAEVDRDAILGKYTTSRVLHDQPLRRAALGPRLDDAPTSELVVTALNATPGQALNGALARGDQVRLLLSADAVHRPPVAIAGVLVLDVSPPEGDRPQYVLTFGLNGVQRDLYTGTEWTRWELVREKPYEQP